MYVVFAKPANSLTAPTAHATVTSGEDSTGPSTGMPPTRGKPQVVARRRGAAADVDGTRRNDDRRGLVPPCGAANANGLRGLVPLRGAAKPAPASASRGVAAGSRNERGG